MVDAADTALVELKDRMLSLYVLGVETAAAYKAFADYLMSLQARDGISPDRRVIMLGRGDPNDAASTYQYRGKVSEVIARATHEGMNVAQVRGACVVLAYSVWEVEYRPRLAAAAGLSDTTKLASPTFGDLRKFRNALAHNGVLAQAPEVLWLFQKGDRVVFDEEKYFKLFEGIVEGLRLIGRDYFGKEVPFTFGRPIKPAPKTDV